MTKRLLIPCLLTLALSTALATSSPSPSMTTDKSLATTTLSTSQGLSPKSQPSQKAGHQPTFRQLAQSSFTRTLIQSVIAFGVFLVIQESVTYKGGAIEATFKNYARPISIGILLLSSILCIAPTIFRAFNAPSTDQQSQPTGHASIQKTSPTLLRFYQIHYLLTAVILFLIDYFVAYDLYKLIDKVYTFKKGSIPHKMTVILLMTLITTCINICLAKPYFKLAEVLTPQPKKDDKVIQAPSTKKK